MDVDLFGNPMTFPIRRRFAVNGYSAAPGSGPAGETCGSCGHHYVRRLSNAYHKCDLVKATGGPGTDVRVRSAACWRWTKSTTADGVRRTPGTDLVGRLDSGSADQ